MHFIPERYALVTFYFFMALLMSGLMSLVVTTINMGWVPNLVSIWIKAWTVGFIAALPAIMVVTPMVKKIVQNLVAKSAVT